jgi:hypothetical protein
MALLQHPLLALASVQAWGQVSQLAQLLVVVPA